MRFNLRPDFDSQDSVVVQPFLLIIELRERGSKELKLPKSKMKIYKYDDSFVLVFLLYSYILIILKYKLIHGDNIIRIYE